MRVVVRQGFYCIIIIIIIRISGENNIIQSDRSDSSTKLFIWAMFGVLGVPIRLNCLK